jgi:hypothetical protein
MEVRYKCRNIIITTYDYSKLGRLEEKSQQQKQQEATNEEEEHKIHNLQSLQFHVHPIVNSIKPNHDINPWPLQMLRQESSLSVGQKIRIDICLTLWNKAMSLNLNT